MVNEKPLITIRVMKSEPIPDRLKRVSAGLDALKPGEYGQITSDDELMLKVAPKMMESIGKARFIRSWEQGGLYRTLVEKQ